MSTQIQPPKELIESTETVKSGEIVYTVPSTKVRKIIADWLANSADLHLSTIVVEDALDYFELYYYFINRMNNEKIVLLTKLEHENPEIDSIDDLINSVFYEGESTEMFGIKFTNNPVVQVFLPEDWKYGNPLRKDWVDPREEEQNNE